MTLEQKRFIAGLKKHAKPLLNFLAIYENLNFDEDRGEYRCDKDPSIKVYKAKKNQVWRVQDMSGKTRYNHTLTQLIYEELQKYCKEEKAEECSQLLKRIGEHKLPTPRKAFRKKKTRQKPTQKRKTPQCVEYEDTDHPQLNATLRYFKEKTGATCNDLKKYGIKAVASPDDSGHFSFAYNTSNATKLKTPDNKKESKYEFTRKEGPYCFGLKQLPEKGQRLFICEGEDDALTMNIHSPDDTGAISFGGTAITKEQGEIVEKLKTRFETIYITYDSDTAGIENTRKNAERCKVVPINTETAFKFISKDPQAKPPKDLCDLYIEYRKRTQPKETKNPKPEPKPKPTETAFSLFESTKPIKETAEPEPVNTETTAEIKEPEPFKNTIEQLIKFCEKVKRFNSPSPNTIYNKYEGGHYSLGINQYITEPEGEAFPFIKKMLIINDRNVLTAPAGAGKTTMLIKLCERNEGGEIDFLEKTNTEKIVIALPTTAIATQLYNDFKEAGATDVILVSGGKTKKEEGELEKIVICVFDKTAEYVNKRQIQALRYPEKELTEESKTFLIIDEYHQTANDYEYRKKAMESITQVIAQATKTLLISATPNLLYCNEKGNKEREENKEGERGHFLFGFNLIKCAPRITNKIQCTICKHSATSIDIIASIIDQHKKGTGLVIIKRDNLTDLIAAQSIIRREKKAKAIIIAGSERKYKEGSKHYKKLIRTGEINSDVDYLLTTTFLEAGINIKTPVHSIHLIDTRNSDRIIQASNRPRLGTDGSNEKTRVFVYFGNKQRGEDKYKEHRGRNGMEIYNNLLLKGKKDSAALNKFKSDQRAEHLYKDTDEDMTRTGREREPAFDEYGNEHYIENPAGITNEMYKIETSYTTDNPKELKRQIEITDPRFTVKIENVDIKKNTATAGAIKERKAIEKERTEHSREELTKLICGDSSQQITLECLCALSKSRKIKEFLKTHFNIVTPKGFGNDEDDEQNQKKRTLNDHISTNRIAFQYPESKRNSYLNQLKNMVESRNEDQCNPKKKAFLPPKEIAKITIKEKTATIKQMIREMVVGRREEIAKIDKKRLNKRDQLERYKSNGVKKAARQLIENIKAGRRKNDFTAEELAKKVNKAINNELKRGGIEKRVAVNNKTAVKMIQTHRRIDSRKGNKRKKRYFFVL